jgi:hypothetical protein
MKSSNTGLDFIDLTILTTGSPLTSTTPTSNDSSDSSRDDTATPATLAANEARFPSLALSTKLGSLNLISQTAITPPASAPRNSLDRCSGSTPREIARISQAYVCRVQGCSVRFTQLRQLKCVAFPLDLMYHVLAHSYCCSAKT